MTNLDERLQDEKATLITRVAELEQALAHERWLREAAEAERDRAKAESDHHNQLATKYFGELQTALERISNLEAGREIEQTMLRNAASEIATVQQYASRLLTALVAQRQALSNRAGYCWHCSNYTGEDKVQGGHGDDVHEDWCQIGALATDHAALVSEGETLGVTPT